MYYTFYFLFSFLTGFAHMFPNKYPHVLNTTATVGNISASLAKPVTIAAALIAVNNVGVNVFYFHLISSLFCLCLLFYPL